ncbi:MAG TPA: DCC1-like thiol-disulfide oxidoreductase family protein [Thermoplasmata archaeon]|nr:DCC1-like thiol-disulfide oxidoreductase family protein [Thermoplasmata archaeon]
MSAREYVLLYDGECGLCGAFGRWVHAADLRRRIRIRSAQSSWDLLLGLPDDQVLAVFHMIDPGGRITSGGDAVATLIEAFPVGVGFARVLRGSETLMRRVRGSYRFLAQFRDRLVCRVAPGATSAGSSP